MRQRPSAHLVAQCLCDDVLADEIGEAFRSVTTIEGDAHDAPFIVAAGPQRIESRAPHVVGTPPALTRPPGSDQVAPRHPRETAYRCFLPDLTGFTGPSCAGPSRQRQLARSGPDGRAPSVGSSTPL